MHNIKELKEKSKYIFLLFELCVFYAYLTRSKMALLSVYWYFIYNNYLSWFWIKIKDDQEERDVKTYLTI